MSKKKGNSKILPPITSMLGSFEIDYEKLATAIVKANNMAYIKTTSKTRLFLMNMFNGTMLAVICVVCGYVAFGVWNEWSSFLTIPARVILSAGLALLACACFLAQQESLDDNQRETRENFNTTISFMSLIIAVLAIVIASKK